MTDFSILIFFLVFCVSNLIFKVLIRFTWFALRPRPHLNFNSWFHVVVWSKVTNVVLFCQFSVADFAVVGLRCVAIYGSRNFCRDVWIVSTIPTHGNNCWQFTVRSNVFLVFFFLLFVHFRGDFFVFYAVHYDSWGSRVCVDVFSLFLIVIIWFHVMWFEVVQCDVVAVSYWVMWRHVNCCYGLCMSFPSMAFKDFLAALSADL